MRLAVLVMAMVTVLSLPLASASFQMEDDLQYLSCLEEGDCRLTTVPSGEDTVTGQSQGTPFAPERVLFEFELYPAQDELALLPERLTDVKVDLRFDDDPTRLTWPDVTMTLVHGDGSTSWTMAANEGTSWPAYAEDEVELDLDDGRVMWPGDGARLLLSFSVDRIATWTLHLYGDSTFEMDVAWSADPAAADVDEPSSRSSPAPVEFESAHDGALVGGESDCFTFTIETHEALRVLITWDVVPLELQQQSAQPELRLSTGLMAPTPEVEVVADDDGTLTRYRWRALQEGDATLCLEGQHDRFQPYVWAGLLSFEGMGPVDPSGFTGEGLYPAGGGQVEAAGSSESLPEPPNGLRALPGVMLLCVGLLEFTRRTTSWTIRWGLSVPGLILILLGGVFNPLISASTAVQQDGELDLDGLVDERLAQLWDVAHPGVPESTLVTHSGATFGRLNGEELHVRLVIQSATPLEDGRYQLHPEGLDDLRLDERIFAHVAKEGGAGGPEADHVQRFVLLAGRSLLLDLIALEALLVTDDRPSSSVVHLRTAMVDTAASGSVTAPAWATRPASIDAGSWSVLQDALLPQRIAVSLCDCDLDLLDVRFVAASGLQSSDLPNHDSITSAGSFLGMPGLVTLLGVVMLGAGAGLEHRRRSEAERLAERMLGDLHSWD